MSVPMELHADITTIPKEGKVLVLTRQGHWFVVEYAPKQECWVGSDSYRAYANLEAYQIVLWSPVPQGAELSSVSSESFLV